MIKVMVLVGANRVEVPYKYLRKKKPEETD